MVCFGAVLFDDPGQSFYGQTRPVCDRFVPEALAVSGFSREQHLGFDDPKAVMEAFALWLDKHVKGRAVFVSDNIAFDWQFINYYFHRFLGKTCSAFPAEGSAIFTPASSKTHQKRRSGRNTGSPNTRTIPWTTPGAMRRR